MILDNYKRAFFLGAVVATLHSCNINNNEQRTGKGEEIYVRFKNQGQTQYYVDINTETTIQFSVNDNEVRRVSSARFGLIYEFLKDTGLQPKEQLLKITYDKFVINSDNNGKITEINSENGSNTFNKTEKIFSAIKGSSVWVVLDSAGKFKSIKGSEQIFDKIATRLSELDISNKKFVEGQLKNILGEKFVKSNIETGFKFLPDSSMHIGDSWSKDEIQESEIPYQLHSIYTLNNAKDNIVFIDMESDIHPKENVESDNILGVNIARDITGKQTGTYKVNIKTGLLQEAHQKARIKGALHVQGRDIPIQIEIKRNVLLQQMK